MKITSISINEGKLNITYNDGLKLPELSKYKCLSNSGCTVSTDDDATTLADCLNNCTQTCSSATNNSPEYANVLCDNNACAFDDTPTNLPRLCDEKDSSSCNEMYINPSDMDFLAKEIAKGGDNEINAKFILNKIASRYITKIIIDHSSYKKCKAYNGQLGGKWTKISSDKSINRKSKKFTNGVWRKDSEVKNVRGCGWWGRGAIQTTGPCNYGLLQEELKSNPTYQNMFNLCKTPDLICNTVKWPELKWISGFVYWLGTGVQNYTDNYDFNKSIQDAADAFSSTSSSPDKNQKFIDFVNETSGLVNRGCPKLTCDGTGVDGADNRLTYSKKVWEMLYTGLVSANKKLDDVVKDNYTKIFDAITEETFNNTVTIKINGKSNPYTYTGFKNALNIVLSKTDGGEGGIGDFSFYTNEQIGVLLVNLSAYLGQCKQETIQYGTCDENNSASKYDPGGPTWDPDPGSPNTENDFCKEFNKESDCNSAGVCIMINGSCQQYIYGDGGPQGPKNILKNWNEYPIVASCGQNGESYSELTCDETASTRCDTSYLDDRNIVALTNSSWNSAPGPLISMNTNFDSNTTYYWNTNG